MNSSHVYGNEVEAQEEYADVVAPGRSGVSLSKGVRTEAPTSDVYYDDAQTMSAVPQQSGAPRNYDARTYEPGAYEPGAYEPGTYEPGEYEDAIEELTEETEYTEAKHYRSGENGRTWGGEGHGQRGGEGGDKRAEEHHGDDIYADIPDGDGGHYPVIPVTVRQEPSECIPNIPDRPNNFNDSSRVNKNNNNVPRALPTESTPAIPPLGKASGPKMGTRVYAYDVNTIKLKEKKTALRHIPNFGENKQTSRDDEDQSPDPATSPMSVSERMKLFEKNSNKSQGNPPPQAKQRSLSHSTSSSSSSSTSRSPGAVPAANTASGGPPLTAPAHSGSGFDWKDSSGGGSGSGVYCGIRRAAPGERPPMAVPEERPPMAVPAGGGGSSTNTRGLVVDENENQVEGISLTEYPWYRGSINREQCEAQLRPIGSEGAFLVRDSRKPDPAHPYTLSVIHGGEIYHVIVARNTSAQYSLPSKDELEKAFNSVAELVAYYETKPFTVVPRDGRAVTGSQVLLCFENIYD